jgi:hypothetical protein
MFAESIERDLRLTRLSSGDGQTGIQLKICDTGFPSSMPTLSSFGIQIFLMLQNTKSLSTYKKL